MAISREAVLQAWRDRVKAQIVRACRREGLNCDCDDGHSCPWCRLADRIIEEVERDESTGA